MFRNINSQCSESLPYIQNHCLMFRELLYPCWIFVGLPRLWNPCRFVLLWNDVNLCSEYLWRCVHNICELVFRIFVKILFDAICVDIFYCTISLDTIDVNCRDTREIFLSILTMAERWVVLIFQPHLHI